MSITLKANVSMELKYVITTGQVKAFSEFVSTLDTSLSNNKFLVDTLNEKGPEEALKRLLTACIRSTIKDTMKEDDGVTASPAKVTFHD